MARAVYGARAVPVKKPPQPRLLSSCLVSDYARPACPPLLLCCCGETRAANDPSVFTITEKAFSWLKVLKQLPELSHLRDFKDTILHKGLNTVSRHGLCLFSIVS